MKNTQICSKKGLNKYILFNLKIPRHTLLHVFMNHHTLMLNMYSTRAYPCFKLQTQKFKLNTQSCSKLQTRKMKAPPIHHQPCLIQTPCSASDSKNEGSTINVALFRPNALLQTPKMKAPPSTLPYLDPMLCFRLQK